MSKHLSLIRDFSPSLEFEEVSFIREKYEGDEWDYAKEFLRMDRPMITKSAFRVSQVIEHHLGVELFPFILKVAGGAWDASGGTAYFAMMGKNGTCYLFWNPAKDFKSMKGAYEKDGNEFYRLKNPKNEE